MLLYFYCLEFLIKPKRPVYLVNFANRNLSYFCEYNCAVTYIMYNRVTHVSCPHNPILSDYKYLSNIYIIVRFDAISNDNKKL